jgi:hypothetical protein
MSCLLCVCVLLPQLTNEMPCVPCTGIVGNDGRAFGRENSGVYIVQLDGFPGLVRVCPLFSDIPIRNISVENPVPVTASIVKYDTASQVFHGSVQQSTFASIRETCEVGEGVCVRPITRRLLPMAF